MKTPDTLKGAADNYARVRVYISPELFAEVADLVHKTGHTFTGTLNQLLSDALKLYAEAEGSDRHDTCEC